MTEPTNVGCWRTDSTGRSGVSPGGYQLPHLLADRWHRDLVAAAENLTIHYDQRMLGLGAVLGSRHRINRHTAPALSSPLPRLDLAHILGHDGHLLAFPWMILETGNGV